jgi:hypothetical protein
MAPISSREQNLRLLKLAAEGKLTADDLVCDPDNPTFDITLHLGGIKPVVSEAEAQQINRLKARGQYFDITLDLSK